VGVLNLQFCASRSDFRTHHVEKMEAGLKEISYPRNNTKFLQS